MEGSGAVHRAQSPLGKPLAAIDGQFPRPTKWPAAGSMGTRWFPAEARNWKQRHGPQIDATLGPGGSSDSRTESDALIRRLGC